MPITAAVIGDLRVRAVLAAHDMAAESHRAAALDRRHHLQLAETDVTCIGLPPCRAMVAEDIRDLQGGRAMIAVAYAGGFFSDVSGVSRSNGLMTARITLVANRSIGLDLYKSVRFRLLRLVNPILIHGAPGLMVRDARHRKEIFKLLLNI